jgi:hypothetical protein
VPVELAAVEPDEPPVELDEPALDVEPVGPVDPAAEVEPEVDPDPEEEPEFDGDPDDEPLLEAVARSLDPEPLVESELVPAPIPCPPQAIKAHATLARHVLDRMCIGGHHLLIAAVAGTARIGSESTLPSRRSADGRVGLKNYSENGRTRWEFGRPMAT